MSHAAKLNPPVSQDVLDAEVERLRRAWDEGIASGIAGPLDMEAIICEAKRKRAARLQNG